METGCEGNNAEDGPYNLKDAFEESDKLRIYALIDQLGDLAITEEEFEHAYQEYAEIFSKYQEQPHLLDRSLEEIVKKIIPHLKDASVELLLKHRAAKYLYQVCKVRTFKTFGKSLPHEVHHLSSVLSLVEQQDLKGWQNWETRYIGILWLSHLVLNPFDLSRLDSSEEGCATTMDRIYDICMNNCLKDDSCTPVAAFLAARFLIRNDVKTVCLEKFLDWAMTVNERYSIDAKIGPLVAISCILKHGKREDLLPFVDKVCVWVLNLNYETISKHFKIYKTCIKICQRLGLVMLPPKIAKWRYQRGARLLLTNVQKTATAASLKEVQQAEAITECTEDEDATDDEEVPGAIEEIVEKLLFGLKGNSTIVRWSSAKGIGRITNRLPKLLGDEVVSSVIELLNPLEQDDAWHGACLALAELAKRGLLLPSRLTEIVPLLLQALVYDEMQGYRNVGQNIRDAACYMSWAFARAYHPSVLQPFVERIASALLVTAVFDREINCRRAASAAFQESVGRLGNFPHGIDILTIADFFSVAVRSNAFLNISEFIAQFEEYKYTLIEHLITRKINHWDTNIRELSAQALSHLTKQAPQHMRDTIVPRLFQLAESTELNTRHGAILSLGDVINTLQKLSTHEANADKLPEGFLTAEVGDLAGQLIDKYRERGQLKGMSGTLMKSGCASFIRNCSEAMLPLPKQEYIDSWQLLLDECIIDEKSSTREEATVAYARFCATYYRTESNERMGRLVDNYVKALNNTQIEHKAQGIVSVLGALPLFMLELRLSEIVQVINLKLTVPEMYAVGYNHSELRRDCIRALRNIVETVGFSHSPKANEILCGPIFGCYLRALEEYVLDNRGDIGSWVREASISALYAFLTKCPDSLLTPQHVQDAMVAIAKQSVERIDKIRAVAGKAFTALIYHDDPPIPNMEQRDRLQEIFPRDTKEVLWLFPHHTFPLFIELLGVPAYVEQVTSGLILSIGAPTESLHSCASKILNDYLKSHQSFIPSFGAVVLKTLKAKTPKDPLFTSSTLQFLAELLSSSTNSKILLDPDDGAVEFAEPVFSLVNDLMVQTKKHIDSIPVYCALMLAPKICKRVLSKLVVFLGMLCVNIRRETALKMYETLLVYGDQTSIPEENLDEVLMCLSEEKWDGELEEARRIRNQLCILMDVKPPVMKIKK